MDGNTQKVKMEVRPIVHNGQPNWELEIVNGKKGGPGNYPAVNVEEKKSAEFEIKIVDGNGITFSGDPIWIQAGTAKPTQHVVDPQITDISGQNATKLKFEDANSGDAMTLTYRLNFSDGAPPLDPIIQNGGGGGPPSYDYVLYAGAVLLLGALLLTLLRLNKNRASKPMDR